MEQILNKQFDKLRHRYVKDSDIGYSFSLIKNINVYFIYININKGNNLDMKYLKKANNEKNNKNFTDIIKKIKIKKDINNLLLEGIIDNNIFYAYDVLIYEDIECNLNYKNRYNLLKKILNELNIHDSQYDNPIKILKTYVNNTLENIMYNIIPTLNLKINYIIMTHNFSRQFIDLQQHDNILLQKEKHDNIAERNLSVREIDRVETLKNNNNKNIAKRNYYLKVSEIPKNIKFQILSEAIFEVYKTNKPEIYIIKLQDNDFLIVRIPNIKISKELKELFSQKYCENIKCKCKYNKYFDKYDIISIIQK